MLAQEIEQRLPFLAAERLIAAVDKADLVERLVGDARRKEQLNVIDVDPDGT